MTQVTTAPETFTPGPWDFVTGKTLLHIETAMDNSVVGGGHPICSVPKKSIANARLIAAAPAMRKALQMIADGGDDVSRFYQEIAQEAIDKAA